jgi:cytochrome c551/c552
VNDTLQRQSARWPALIVLGLLILSTLVFMVAFIATTQNQPPPPPNSPSELSSSTYMDTIIALLADANPENGAHLIEQYGCITCHRLALVGKVAPSFEGIAARAASRRPPLTAAAYIYESITNPAAYVVEGYQPVMPQNFAERLSDPELSDILAYLLTSTAH